MKYQTFAQKIANVGPMKCRLCFDCGWVWCLARKASVKCECGGIEG